MALTLADVIGRVRDQLRDQSQQVFNNTEIVRYTQDWLREVAANEGAFVKTTTLSTVASTRVYSLPTDFLQMIRVWHNDSIVLPEASVDHLAYVTGDFTDTGTPFVYYLERDPVGVTSQVMLRIGFFPVPSAAVTVRYFYQYMPAVPSAMSDRLVLPPGYDDGVVPYICWQLRKSDREPEEAERYKREYLEEMGRLKSRLRKSPNSHLQMGSDEAASHRLWGPFFDPANFPNP